MQTDLLETIYAMWIALGVLWLGAAFTAKKKERAEPVASRLVHIALMALAFSLLFKPQTGIGPLGTRLVPEWPAAAYIGLGGTIAGVLLAAFARLCLGGNWSAVVSIKDGHQLVRRGPYALVRHPIYSGMLLGFVGTSIAIGEWRCFLGLALAVIGFWQKSRLEERFLIEQFGAEYVEYRKHVRALVP